MDIKSTLTNPWVIGGGLGLVVLIALARGGSASASPSPLSALSSLNASVSQNYSTSTAARVALGNAAYTTYGQTQGIYAGLLSNLAAMQAKVLNDNAVGNAGVISSAVAAHSFLAADISNNASRVQNTGIAGTTSVTTIGTNAQASQAMARSAASANIVGSISNAVVGIAEAATKAAAYNG